MTQDFNERYMLLDDHSFTSSDETYNSYVILPIVYLKSNVFIISVVILFFNNNTYHFYSFYYIITHEE